jgi:2-methylcitrate dehydratase PrpD
MNRSLADTPVDKLARFVSSLEYDALPAAVVAKAKIHIADTLGAAIAGARSNEFAISVKSLRLDGPVRLWGTGLAASTRDAALLNGCAAHAFELDDSGGCDHSGAVVLPALFSALHEAGKPIDGRRMITAVVAGYDVGRRILGHRGLRRA